MAFRPFMLAALVLPSLVACGGDEEEGNVVPEGAHTHYVANSVLVPTTQTQAREYGLDLDGDGPVDNTLGMVLSTIGGMGIDIQATIDKAVATGDITLLLDFQTTDPAFKNAKKSGIQAFLADTAAGSITPAPCNAGETYNETAGTGCGHHLGGTGTFSVSSTSPSNLALGGTLANGQFKGGPGTLALQIALGGTTPINLNLIGARAKGSGITATEIGSMVFAGAITKDDIDNMVIPAIVAQLSPIITRDCDMLDNPAGGCGCMDPSTGKTILGLFDTKKLDGTDGKDCMITDDEIKTNSLIVSLLSPDVVIDGKDALSLGIKVTGAAASFTVSGQL